MNRITLVALALLMALASIAAAGRATPPSPAAREIEQLITALGNSGCQFQRNGRWHEPAQAQAHLRGKYEWLRKRDRVDSADRFIEGAASKSSATGRAYQVRCPGRPAVTSAAWLRSRLVEIRRTMPSR